MSTSVYSINKGINRSIQFKGYKAQYIWYLGGGLLTLLIVFAVLYICGVHPFICLGIVVFGGTCLFIYIRILSDKYGEYGLMKKIGKKGIPKIVSSHSRKIFQKKYLKEKL